MKKRREDPSIVYRISYRMVRFKGPLAPLGAVLSLKVELPVGSKMKVIAESGE